MPARLIPSFLLFCFVNGITPGPANLCSLSAALNYGRARALRQWRGLFTGFAIIALLSVLANYFLGSALGGAVRYLSYIGAAYLLYLAWRLLKSSVAGEAEAPGDCSFFTGLTVQLTNAKVIIFCMTALSSFVLPYSHSFWALLPVGLFLPFTGPICNLAWLFAGVSLQRVFREHRRIVNIVMSLSLALCAVSLLKA